MKPTAPGRLHAQALDGPRFDDTLDVVRHLTCVQAQLLDMALWGVARRVRGAITLAAMRDVLDAGDVLRTHVLRPTWHLVVRDDVHWLQQLTGPRVRRLVAATNRSIGLADDVVERGVSAIVHALADGRPRTRAELGTLLAEAGLQVDGQALAHVLMSAEVDTLVASGPPSGRHHTYRLLEPATAPARPREELLAEVARRYARGHGPVRDRDLAWWTSLTLTDSRRAVELGGLRPVDVDGATWWTIDEPVVTVAPDVMLLPNFDEYISYARDADDLAGVAGVAEQVMRATGLLFVDGRLAGSWTRSMGARRVTVDVRPAVRVTASVRRGLRRETEAFGRFVDRDPELRIAD